MPESYTAKDLSFVIPAYGESPYLGACVRSVLKQAVKENVIIATATANDRIRAVAEKFDVRLAVREEDTAGPSTGSGIAEDGASHIAADWNFAYAQAKTRLVTLAHQDDLYGRNYAKEVLRALNKAKHPLIAFTDYAEIRGKRAEKDNALLGIKRLMLLPLRIRPLQSSVKLRRILLSFGSPICCPSVCYVKEHLPSPLFTEGYRTDLDWQAWERISRREGEFVYCPRLLTAHRIHAGAETTKAIGDHTRAKEDEEMFGKFWPAPVAKVLARMYHRAEELN